MPGRLHVLRTTWSWRRDLNPRPADYKSAALPTELRQQSKPPPRRPQKRACTLLWPIPADRSPPGARCAGSPQEDERNASHVPRLRRRKSYGCPNDRAKFVSTKHPACSGMRRLPPRTPDGPPSAIRTNECTPFAVLEEVPLGQDGVPIRRVVRFLASPSISARASVRWRARSSMAAGDAKLLPRQQIQSEDSR